MCEDAVLKLGERGLPLLRFGDKVSAAFGHVCGA